MTRSIDPSTYPEAFWTIVREVKRGMEITIEYPMDGWEEKADGSRVAGCDKKAQTMRFLWYGFVHALKRSGQPEASKCAGIEVGFRGWVEGSGEPAQVVFRSRDEEGKWKELNAAVAKFGGGHKVDSNADADEAIQDYMRKAGQMLTEETPEPEVAKLMGFEEEPRGR